MIIIRVWLIDFYSDSTRSSKFNFCIFKIQQIAVCRLQTTPISLQEWIKLDSQVHLHLLHKAAVQTLTLLLALFMIVSSGAVSNSCIVCRLWASIAEISSTESRAVFSWLKVILSSAAPIIILLCKCKKGIVCLHSAHYAFNARNKYKKCVYFT